MGRRSSLEVKVILILTEIFSSVIWNTFKNLRKLWLWNMVPYIKGGMKAKGIRKQDTEANISAQEGWEWGVEKAP